LLLFFIKLSGFHSVLIITILSQFIFLNIALAVFNMLPLEPLDGFKVVGGILPGSLALQWYETAQYGIYVLLLMLITGAVDKIIYPVSKAILNLLLIPFSF
jgi:Zn-dependent protease